MSLLEKFKVQFNERHDFEHQDIDTFLNRWKNKTIFKNIPHAWIIPLDTMMFELNKKNYIVSSVSQEYGQLIAPVPADTNAFNAMKIIEIAKKKIKSIDEDLYLLFDINIAKEYTNQRIKDTINSYHQYNVEGTN